MNEERLKTKAEAYFAKGKWSKALKTFLVLSEQTPQDLRLRLRVAETLTRLDRKPEAQILLRRIADLYTKDGQLHKAIAINQRLLDLDRDDREAQARLAALYERQGKQSSRELPIPPDEVDQAVTEACRDSVLNEVSEYRERLRQARTRGDFAVALECALKLWRLQPADAQTRLEIAWVLLSLKRKREAFDLFFSVANQLLRDGNLLRALFLWAAIDEEVLPDKKRELKRRLSIVAGRTAEAKPDQHQRPSGFLNRLHEFRQRREIVEDMLEEILTDPLELGKVRPVALISQLPRHECEALLERLKPRTLAAGEMLFSRQATADSLFWITQGTVGLYEAVQVVPAQAAPQHLLGETEMLGLFGFLADGRRRQTAIAHSECEVLVLSRKDFDILCSEFPKIRDVFDAAYLDEILPIFLEAEIWVASWSREERRKLALRFETERFTAQSDFRWNEGEVLDKLVFLREGVVDVFQGTLYEDAPLYSLTAGHFLGALEWLIGARAAASLRASGSLTVLTLSKSALTAGERESLEDRERIREYLKERPFLPTSEALAVVDQLARKQGHT